MISIRSLFGLSLSVIIHGSVGVYFLNLPTKVEPPKPKEIPMTVAMFKTTPPPPAPIVKPAKPKPVTPPIPEQPPTEEVVKVEAPKPIIPEPPKVEPKEAIITEPEPVIKKPAVVKPVIKPVVKVKPKPKPKKIVKKKPKKKVKPKKKKKITPKKVVAKKKPRVKPRKVTPPKQRAVVHKRPVSKPRPAITRAQAPKKPHRIVKKRVVVTPRKPPAKKVPRQVNKPKAPARKVGNPQLERQYSNNIRQMIEKKKVYPRKAKRRKQQGTVTVSFSVNKAGIVSKLRIVKSSGSKTLDNAALLAIKQVGRFPAIPVGIQKTFLSYTIPISYRLR